MSKKIIRPTTENVKIIVNFVEKVFITQPKFPFPQLSLNTDQAFKCITGLDVLEEKELDFVIYRLGLNGIPQKDLSSIALILGMGLDDDIEKYEVEVFKKWYEAVKKFLPKKK